MKTLIVNDMKIEIPKGNSCPIKTSKNMLNPMQNVVCIGKRNSGKSTAITNYFRMLKKEDKAMRIFVISTTFDSNKKLMKNLDIQEEDVYQPDCPEIVIEDIISKCEEERDLYLKYHEEMKRWNLLQSKLNNRNIYIDDIEPDLMLQFLTPEGFEKPTHKWNGLRPNMYLFIDDCQSTPLFRCQKFLNLITRHRHIAAFPEGSALGIQVFTAIQNYKSQYGGCPRTVKNNCTTLILFSMKDKAELKECFESVAGEIDEQTFYEVYNYATKESHSFLLIDLHPKKDHPSKFRKNFDEFIIIDENQN